MEFMTPHSEAAKKVANILEFIEQPLTFAQKEAMEHVLVLACPQVREDSAYWPDDQDPLGQVHASEKLEKALWTARALAVMVLSLRGHESQAVKAVNRCVEEDRAAYMEGRAQAELLIDSLTKGPRTA